MKIQSTFLSGGIPVIGLTPTITITSIHTALGDDDTVIVSGLPMVEETAGHYAFNFLPPAYLPTSTYTVAVDGGAGSEPNRHQSSVILSSVEPGPAPGFTTAWMLCLDSEGNPEAGVQIFVNVRRWLKTYTGKALSRMPTTAISGSDGIASVQIVRSPLVRFGVRRELGDIVEFQGADSATLEMPTVKA